MPNSASLIFPDGKLHFAIRYWLWFFASNHAVKSLILRQMDWLASGTPIAAVSVAIVLDERRQR
jgi:hypothetical protein